MIAFSPPRRYNQREESASPSSFGTPLMSLAIRIYYNAVFGGLGGLLGWMLYGVFFDARQSGAAHWLFSGCVIGGSIGYLVVSVEAIRDYSLVRFCRLATYGLVLGAIGGAMGMLSGEVMNSWIVSGV